MQITSPYPSYPFFTLLFSYLRNNKNQEFFNSTYGSLTRPSLCWNVSSCFTWGKREREVMMIRWKDGRIVIRKNDGDKRNNDLQILSSHHLLPMTSLSLFLRKDGNQMRRTKYIHLTTKRNIGWLTICIFSHTFLIVVTFESLLWKRMRLANIG